VARAVHAPLWGGNRQSTLEVPDSQTPETPHVVLAEGSRVVRGGHAPNDAETSSRACGLLAAPFGAVFGGP
jgi:hypothetical protein